jgi:lysozyme
MRWTESDQRQLLADLMVDEGWRAHAYQDHLGFWSIGYGFLIDARRPNRGLPREVAELWLSLLAREKADELRRRWPAVDRLPVGVRRAVLNMVYQLGVNGFLLFRNTIAALERGDWAAAATQALDSNWARQTPTRAARIAALIRQGR